MFMKCLNVVLLAGSLAMAGCVVSKDKYESAVTDLQSTEAELEKARAVNKALDQQVNNLKELNRRLVAEQESIESKVRTLEAGRDQVRQQVEDRVKELERKIRELIIQSRNLHREAEALKKENRALNVTVRRYQKELAQARERLQAQSRRRAETRSQPVEKKEKKTENTAMRRAMEQTSKPKPVTAPPKSALAPININDASTNDLVLYLGLSKETAERIVKHRPYQLRGELVARNIVPKPTFDVIKDRITASPPSKRGK